MVSYLRCEPYCSRHREMGCSGPYSWPQSIYSRKEGIDLGMSYTLTEITYDDSANVFSVIFTVYKNRFLVSKDSSRLIVSAELGRSLGSILANGSEHAKLIINFGD